VTTTINNITLSDSIFHGKIDTQNYNFVLTSNPLSFLNAKIYYKYYDRQNRSNQITTVDPLFAGGAPFVNQLFDYTKNNIGVDLEWSLPANFQLGTAYAWMMTNRARGDLPKTYDDKYSAELKWTGLDFITPKIGYERLIRTSNVGTLLKEYAGDQTTENAIAPYIKRFDAAPLTRNTFKTGLDIYPLPSLSFGIGYKYIYSDYKDTILGLRNIKSHELNMDASYTIGKIAHLNAYFDMELSKDDQFQRVFTVGGANPDGSIQNATNYNWDAKTKDRSYAWGAGMEVYIIPKKLTLTLQYDNIRSDGHIDFTYLTAAALAAGRTNDNIDIGSWDSYRLNSFLAKLRYTPTKKITFTVGYAYQDYKYTDASFDNYALVNGAFPPGNSSTALLTGAYANPNYHSHVGFLAAAYRF
jgi:hypothetical protein